MAFYEAIKSIICFHIGVLEKVLFKDLKAAFSRYFFSKDDFMKRAKISPLPSTFVPTGPNDWQTPIDAFGEGMVDFVYLAEKLTSVCNVIAAKPLIYCATVDGHDLPRPADTEKDLLVTPLMRMFCDAHQHMRRARRSLHLTQREARIYLQNLLLSDKVKVDTGDRTLPFHQALGEVVHRLLIQNYEKPSLDNPKPFAANDDGLNIAMALDLWLNFHNRMQNLRGDSSAPALAQG